MPVQSFFRVIRKYILLLAAITFIPTIIVAILVLFVATPVYEATTVLIFPLQKASTFMRRSITELELPVSGLASIFDSSATLYNHIAIMESRSMAYRVREYLLSEKNIDLIQTYPKITNNRRLDTEEEQLRALAKIMMKRIRIEDKNRGVADVICTHTDPVVAAEVSMAYVEMTYRYLNEINHNTQSKLVDFLSIRQGEVEDELINIESEIQQVKEDTGILSVEESARQLIQSYGDIEALVAQAEIDYQGSLTQAQSISQSGVRMEEYYDWLISGNPMSEEPPVPALDSLADQAITRLRSELADLEFERQQSMLWATPDNPEVIALDFQIEALRRELYREFSGYYDAEIASLMVESTSYSAMLNVANDVLAELDGRLGAFPPDERHLIELERDRDVQESIYMVVTQELEQARIQVLRESTPFTVLDEAMVPEKPVKPRKVVLTCGTFVLALWFGILIIFWIEKNAIRAKPGG